MTRRLRVAVIGARRVRQGTGEYVARELARLGCEVTAIVGTTPASIEEARAGLRARHGLEVRGYDSLARVLEKETIDAVAICSPHDAHRSPLELAAEARLHVFCEKPLWWSTGLERQPRSTLEEAVGALCDRFVEAGRALHLNAQWPYTLDAFHALHPQARGLRPASVGMWLGPMTLGADGVVDAGSHLLSMLHALLGPGEVQGARVTPAPGRDAQRVEATYVHATGAARAELLLTPCPTPPRPAGYRLDGFAVERRITLPSYSFSFEADGRTVPVPDPLAASVEDFVRSAAAGRGPDRTALTLGMTGLRALVAAATASRGSP